MPTASRRCTSSYFIYYVSLVVIFFVLRAECFQWIKSVYENNVYANRSSIALFRWKYVLGGAVADNLDIECGYLSSEDVPQIKTLVKKSGHNNPMRNQGRLPGTSDTQVEAYQEDLPGGGVDRSVVGFRIMRAQLTQPRKYYCRATYQTSGGQLKTLPSNLKNLYVLDPPVLLDCLEDLKPVKEGNDIEISCYATGNPPPTLECCLLNSYQSVLKKIPSGGAEAANITLQKFREIDRDAEEIICIAIGKHTGSVNVTVDLVVQHTPRAPEFVEFVPAFNHSSLNVLWTVIPNNETGGELQGYVIEYYVTEQKRISRKTIDLKINVLKRTDDYYTYLITGLNPDVKYTVEVYGYNQFGKGKHTIFEGVPSEILLVESSQKEAEVGVIIGGIIAGIVFIVIFVVLAVWCSTRSKRQEKFPTSHVEDAVDYPPGVGQSLYANVDKNKNKTSRTGSTNEYPDVVHDTSEVRPMVSSASYEQSNKSFV